MTLPSNTGLPDANEPRRRVRELGLPLGRYKPGRWNAITDVSGVLVGHSTIMRGSGPLKRGEGPVRTGVTAILPSSNVFDQRCVGGGFVLNGAGEISGLTQVMEWGLIETPILLTNTLSVGAVSDATVRWMARQHPDIGDREDVIIPVVGECDDSWLNDAVGRHVREEHVVEAIQTASSGPVAEGSVGGGTGMLCCDFKGGIGTSSRKLPSILGGFTMGALVMSNFGNMQDLRMGGYPVGEVLAPLYTELNRRRQIYGSIIVVIGTDAPLMPHQLNRIAKRAALGLGRCGSYAAHGSGEIILAFSSANRIPRTTAKMTYRAQFLIDERMDPLYEATIECVEEAVLNSLCMARPMEGVNGNFAPALPLGLVQEYLRHVRRPMGTDVLVPKKETEPAARKEGAEPPKKDPVETPK